MQKTRIISLARPLTFAWALAALPTVALTDHGSYYSKDQTPGEVSYSYVRCGYGRGAGRGAGRGTGAGTGAGTGEFKGLDTDLYGGIASLAVADYVYLAAFYARAEVDAERDYLDPEI